MENAPNNYSGAVMKSLFFSFAIIFSVFSQAHSLEPNFKLEAVEGHTPLMPQKKSQSDILKFYAFKCIDTEKKIDTRLTIELMNGVSSTYKTEIDNEGYLRLRIYPFIRFAPGFGCGYGESVTLHVESRDYSVETQEPVFYSKLRFVPYPIIEKNDMGVSMSCEALDTQGKNFSILLKGLQPHEEVSFESVTLSKKRSFNGTSDSDGELVIMYSAEIAPKGKNPFRLTASNERIGSVSIRHYSGLEAFTSPVSYVKPKI